MNFQSSFSNTNKFANKTSSVILSKNCEDCKDGAKTFEKQRELLLKQDRQLQENHKIQKGSKEQIKNLKAKTKSLEEQLTETTSLLETALEESAIEITALKAEVRDKVDLLEATKLKKSTPSKNHPSSKEAEIEVALEKCRMCGFNSKSKVVIKQHMMSRHGVKIAQ